MYPYLFIYIFVLIVILVLFFDIWKTNRKAYNVTFKLIYAFLAFLVAFRYYVGPDTASYMFAFDTFPTLNTFESIDFIIYRVQPFYLLLNVICKTIWNNFVLVQIVQAFLFFHSLYLLLKKLDLRKFYILFIFYGYMYGAEMSALRESLGLACCFYAMQFYLKDKWIKYYLLVFAGFMFHSSMLLFTLIPIVKLFKKSTLKNVALLVVIALLFPILYQQFASFGLVLGDDSINRYSDKVNEEVNLGFTTLMYSVLSLLIIVYYMVVKQKEDDNSYRVDFIYLGGVIYVVMNLIGSAYFQIMYRLSAHFAIFFWYTIAQVLKRSRTNSFVTTFFLILVLYPPTARFFSDYSDPDLVIQKTYCSVFSSEPEKQQMKSIQISKDTGSGIFKN